MKILFIWERERERERPHKQREKEGEKKQAPCWGGSWILVSYPVPWNPDLSWRQMFNWLSHPGIPIIDLLRSSVSSWFSVGRLCILRNLSFFFSRSSSMVMYNCFWPSLIVFLYFVVSRVTSSTFLFYFLQSFFF